MKGILMKPDNIRLIREGKKTQTRRLIKPEPYEDTEFVSYDEELKLWWFKRTEYDQSTAGIKPRYLPGELVYVKEAYCCLVDANGYTHYDQFLYRLDNPDIECMDGDGSPVFRKDGSPASPWRSPLFMSESAARTFLRIKEVRPERLQDIHRRDAQAEGVLCRHCKGYTDNQTGCTCEAEYARLWDSINRPPHDWAANDWVWVYSFSLEESK